MFNEQNEINSTNHELNLYYLKLAKDPCESSSWRGVLDTT